MGALDHEQALIMECLLGREAGTVEGEVCERFVAHFGGTAWRASRDGQRIRQVDSAGVGGVLGRARGLLENELALCTVDAYPASSLGRRCFMRTGI
nr:MULTISPECIES: hypothetical protein [unclassified Cyanobium]